LFWSLSLVLLMAASRAVAASSRSGWSIWSAPPLSSSEDLVTEANSRARESLKWASAMISDSKG
jgi:hypothetical protein